MRSTRTKLAVAAAAALTVTAGAAITNAAPDRAPAHPAAQEQHLTSYKVAADARTFRADLADAGVDVEGRLGTDTVISGTPEQIAQLRDAGVPLTEAPTSADTANARVEAVKKAREAKGLKVQTAGDFPAGDEAYHTVDEVVAVLDKTEKDFPELAKKQSIGTSVEGRDLWMMRLGKAPEGSPEIVITCNQHAREHLTTEQCLYLVNELTSKYSSDERVKKIMDTRIVWVMPVMNPDGSAFDVSGGKYQNWRKNRTDNGDGTIGIDLNRNWDYKWACCGGASNSPKSATYRGPSAFAAPETKAVADFVKSRRVGDEQRIKAYLDIHTFGEVVMWPFGHTKDATTEGMTADQAEMLQAVGKKLAESNSYSPEQSSVMYITDGDSLDWAWGDQQIPTIGFEMYPGGPGGGGFYPPAKIIERETSRNREALLTYLELADCQYKLTGKQDKYCKAPAPAPTAEPTPTPTGEPTATDPAPTEPAPTTTETSPAEPTETSTEPVVTPTR